MYNFITSKHCFLLMAPAVLLLSLSSSADSPTGWPEFRGPYANGWVKAPTDATPVNLPLHWSETENIVWKTPIPEKGWSTPVVLDDLVWLTTASPEGTDFFVLAVEAATGTIRYNQKLFHCDTPEDLGNNVNCYASPSPVLESDRVYVHFGSYGTACLDTHTGKVIWRRDDMQCRHFRGPGSSPILFENLLILTFDGVDVQYILALDKLTGKTVWRTDRTTVFHDLDDQGKPKNFGDFRKAFSTPLIIPRGDSVQLLTLGSESAVSYDPRTGKELWKTHNDAYTPASRPLFGNGLAYIITGRGKPSLWGVRVDGAGDVTDTHVVWKLADVLVPTEATPLFLDGLLYVVSNDGYLACVEATTGKKVWCERIGGNFLASPIYADGHVYFSSTQGKTTVIKTGRTFQVVATNKLESGFLASPAVLGKSLFLRSKTHLYRIENGAKPLKTEAAAPAAQH